MDDEVFKQIIAASSEPLQNFHVSRQFSTFSTVGGSRRGDPRDADTPPAARGDPAADTVRALYRRYRHAVRGPCPVQAAARSRSSCHSAAWRAHRRRSACIFLTGRKVTFRKGSVARALLAPPASCRRHQAVGGAPPDHRGCGERPQRRPQTQNLTVIEPAIHGEASGPGSDGWQ